MCFISAFVKRGGGDAGWERSGGGVFGEGLDQQDVVVAAVGEKFMRIVGLHMAR
jgi:hypothetical protein